MTTRDWQAWHRDGYDSGGTSLRARLAVVRTELSRLVTEAPAGPVRILSMCAGEARDLAALAEHPRRADVTGRAVELDPTLAARAEENLAALPGVDVATGDAGNTDAYAGATPADIVLAVGVFGNVEPQDVRATVEALPTLLADRGAVIWTRGNRTPYDRERGADEHEDPADDVRHWFAAAGFAEEAFVSPEHHSYRVGVCRLLGPARPFQPDRALFTFR